MSDPAGHGLQGGPPAGNPARRDLDLTGRRVVVVGLARSGTAAVRFLTSRGADVIVSDRRPETELGQLADEARLLGAALDLGGHTESVFAGADLIVVSPGVPMSLPVLDSARRQGTPVISEIELACRFLRGWIAGITGSNGKSTTTALTAAMLRAAGLRARACGNIGVPLLEMVEMDSPDSLYAVELSSFQLEGTFSLRCMAAIVVNVSPDHLDRYPNYAGYVAAKARIFQNQRPSDVAILNGSDADSRLLLPAVRSRLLRFSTSGPVEEGAFLRGDEIVIARSGGIEPLMAVGEIPLPGRHNVENVMAAALASMHLGASPEAISRGVRAFRALPHRMEPVGETGGVAWINDSKATNVDAALKAIASFPGRRILLVLGGRDKGGDFTAMRPLLTERVGCVYLIGEAAGPVADQIGDAARIVRSGDLERAVADAAAEARPGDVVLLAPACASFDQYRNYEERGEHFRSLVRKLAGGNGAARGSGGEPDGGADRHTGDRRDGATGGAAA